jgi:RNA polymerase sigma-70 factor (ECF subfamily)
MELNAQRAAEAGAEFEDLRLVERLRKGHERAYEELIGRFQQPVYILAIRLLGDPSEAADVVQEVFLKVFRNIGSFRGQSSLKTWIYRITVNESHNARRWFFRHRRREVELDTKPEESRDWRESIPDQNRSPYDEALNQQRHVMIEAALERISPIFREAVVLRDIGDLSYEEIAEVLNVSLGTVKSRILRGREALREQLAGSLESRPALRLVPKTAE